MAYAILRFAKRKGGAAKAIAAHNERTKEAYASNPDIDKSRTVQNEHLIAPRWSYGQEIRHRIGMAGCRVRRDSVKFVETLITTSPEFAKAHESEMPEYFERALGFLKERVGEENIFSAVVHMDEKTPHMHLCFVPLTKDKRLSAKEILGNKKAMIRWQDDFYACMLERWPELERGTPAVETKRRHLTPQWYKRVTAMDTKLEKLETALNGINVLNAGKKREEAVALLAQLLPEVESFQAEIQRMQQAVSRSLTMQRCSAEENETLKDELTAERRKSAEQRAKLTVLEERYKRAEKLLKRLPLVYGDNVIEKHGINRDSTGDREKTRYLCGKQGIFTRDRALIRPGFIRQLETRASTRSASFFHALGSPGRPHNGGGEAGAYRTRNGAKPLKQGHLRAKRGPLGPSRKSQQQTKRTGFAAHGHSIAETAPEGKRASCANGALIRA